MTDEQYDVIGEFIDKLNKDTKYHYAFEAVGAVDKEPVYFKFLKFNTIEDEIIIHESYFIEECIETIKNYYYGKKENEN